MSFQVFSAQATRIEVYVYAAAMGEAELAHVPMVEDPDTKRWSASVSMCDLEAEGLGDTIYYGYRAWGPNWTYDPAWAPGSTKGFVADVDAEGNRFNPNKLLLDALTVELPPSSRWLRVADTGVWMESQGNFVEPGHEKEIHGGQHDVAARSVVLLLEP